MSDVIIYSSHTRFPHYTSGGKLYNLPSKEYSFQVPEHDVIPQCAFVHLRSSTFRDTDERETKLSLYLLIVRI